jgi:hypothetical protein
MSQTESQKPERLEKRLNQETAVQRCPLEQYSKCEKRRQKCNEKDKPQNKLK